MAQLRQFNEIARDFTDVADFVVVYIEEAHPTDGWAFKVRFLKTVQSLGSLHLIIFTLVTNPQSTFSLSF